MNVVKNLSDYVLHSLILLSVTFKMYMLSHCNLQVKMVVFRDEACTKEEDLFDVMEVELVKKPGKGLGLSIVGRKNGNGVFISDVVTNFVFFYCASTLYVIIYLIQLHYNFITYYMLFPFFYY